MKKVLIQFSTAIFILAILFLNVDVVLNNKATSSFQLSSVINVNAQTSSTTSSTTSNTASSTTSSTTSSTVPSSWGSTNPWNTGQYYYLTTNTIVAGTTYQDVSTDGGQTWSISGKLFGASLSFGTPTTHGSTITRTVTVQSTIVQKCCLPGGTDRCDYPAC